MVRLDYFYRIAPETYLCRLNDCTDDSLCVLYIRVEKWGSQNWNKHYEIHLVVAVAAF